MVDIISVTTLIVAVITTVGVAVHKIGCRRLNLCCIDSDCRKGSTTPDSVSINQIEQQPAVALQPKHDTKLEVIIVEPPKTRTYSPTVRRKPPINESMV